jgi:hypothetical protein
VLFLRSTFLMSEFSRRQTCTCAVWK